MQNPIRYGALLLVLAMAACGGSGGGGSSDRQDGVTPTQARDLDRSCDIASYPSAEWTRCEAQNFAKILEAEREGLQPAFQAAQLAQTQRNMQSYVSRIIDDPSWLPVTSPLLAVLLAGQADPASLPQRLMDAINGLISAPTDAAQLPLDNPLLTECATYALGCTGDPFRWPEFDGPDGKAFYENEAEVLPVVFYDRDCSRISGHVWRPRGSSGRLPGIVMTPGSVGSVEPLHYWAAQLLVRNGYAVLAYDPRGQGRTDFASPSGGLGTNINPKVFWTVLVDAIDFFRSGPDRPYPHNQTCAGTYPTEITPYNPQHAVLDLERLGIAGHSLGAVAVSAVQGYGAPGADPWPGVMDAQNPVDVAVAWDGLAPSAGGSNIGGAAGPGAAMFPLLSDPLARLLIEREYPKVKPRVPAMGQSSEYGLLFTPFLAPPDAEYHKAAFREWQEAGVPVYELTSQGSSHMEWSQVFPLPATSYCTDPTSGQCRGGWALPQVEHYTLAWFDRWLKLPGEQGYADADQRLVDDGGEQGAAKLSYRYRSARDYPDRSGKRQHCEDIRGGCQ